MAAQSVPSGAHVGSTSNVPSDLDQFAGLLDESDFQIHGEHIVIVPDSLEVTSETSHCLNIVHAH